MSNPNELLAPTDLLSPSELAGYLGVPVKTIYQWHHRGSGPRYLKVGRHVRYRRSDVELWLESCEVDR
jgi:excisionase family DNA binding protein